MSEVLTKVMTVIFLIATVVCPCGYIYLVGLVADCLFLNFEPSCFEVLLI